MAAFQEPLYIAPTEEHRSTIIFCAGRGAYSGDSKTELEESITRFGISIIETLPHTKWVILGAPERETIFGEMPEWFDLASTSDPYSEQARQLPGLVESVQHVRRIIEEESRLVIRLFLAGISQGMAVTSHVMLSSERDFAGYIGVSGWVPLFGRDRADRTAQFPEIYGGRKPTRGIKTLLMHCADDGTIDARYGREAWETLEAFRLKVEYLEFADGEHEIKEHEGFDAIAAFVTGRPY